jgi:triosephosphate isomerase
MTQRRKLVAGNWKMHGLLGSATEFRKMVQGTESVGPTVDLAVCPPATLVPMFADLARGSRLMVGGQDCHAKPAGAYTGDISAEMLKDAGASLVIVGHSERRDYHHETDADVRAKAMAALRAGLTAIVCVGETGNEHESGQTVAVIGHQLDGSLPEEAGASNLIVAYEPIWAIGTGKVPTPAAIAETHAFIRNSLVHRFPQTGAGMRILYGGSVKPSNAAEILTIPDVDGALVGGASLVAEEFLAIAKACG